MEERKRKKNEEAVPHELCEVLAALSEEEIVASFASMHHSLLVRGRVSGWCAAGQNDVWFGFLESKVFVIS